MRFEHQAAGSPLAAIRVLSDSSRWRMFWFIRREGRGVTREEAAESLGISRKLAAFHLDKLVQAGLLRTSYESSGEIRRVGRRPKVYEPTGAQISVSIPQRRHELFAELLLDAVIGHRVTEGAADAAVRTARERGRAHGRAARDDTLPGKLGRERGLTACTQMLEEFGYEPVREGSRAVRLRNCPFDPLAAKAPTLVCGMNHAFLAGYLEGLELAGIEAVLETSPGHCCVRLVVC